MAYCFNKILINISRRPLEEDVETAVLEILIGKVLKPGSKSRKVYDYSTPYISTFAKKRRCDVIEYNHQENGEKIEVLSIDDDRKSIDSNSRRTSEKNLTPIPYQQDLLQLSDKILEASRQKTNDTKNPVLNELLDYGEGARYILYNLTLKDKSNLNKLIEIIKNPYRETDAAFFNEMKEKFREYANSRIFTVQLIMGFLNLRGKIKF
uniref:Uncharacterized protein n=1 Tax=Romanomermis culicivorax TaxID=13658 RepID=A0A915JNB8_ROMCU